MIAMKMAIPQWFRLIVAHSSSQGERGPHVFCPVTHCFYELLSQSGTSGHSGPSPKPKPPKPKPFLYRDALELIQGTATD